MNKKYKHLSLEEREKFAILMAKGLSLRKIAEILGRHHSTLSRELKKNKANDLRYFYIPYLAWLRAEDRYHRPRPWRVLKNHKIQAYVEEKIPLGWSPEQVSGRIRIDLPGKSISYEAIYNYIYDQGSHLAQFLPRKRKSRYPAVRYRHRKRIRIPNRTPITERPKSIESRKSFGHWECDTMVSRASKTSLNVLVERKSRYTMISKLNRNTANLNYEAIRKRLEKLNRQVRQSITYDNGMENTKHEALNKALGTKSYFCLPYHSWEKGTVESTNSLIRRIIPKKTNLANVTELDLKRIERLLNNRPRKCLGFKTPKEVFKKQSGALVG